MGLGLFNFIHDIYIFPRPVQDVVRPLKVMRCGTSRSIKRGEKGIIAVLSAPTFPCVIGRASIPRRQPRIPARINGAVEAVVAARFAAERRCADQNAGGVVGGLRVAQLVAHVDQQLLCVGAERESFDFGDIRQPLLVETRGIHGFLNVHAIVDDIDNRMYDHADDAAAAWRADHHDWLAVA